LVHPKDAFRRFVAEDPFHAPRGNLKVFAIQFGLLVESYKHVPRLQPIAAIPLYPVRHSCLTVVALLLLCLGPECRALDTHLRISQYQKQHWQMENGLPHNYVCAVLRAPDGYLLAGTDEGLARFDGVRFTPYDPYPTIGLPKKWILSALVGRDGSTWAGTFDGGLYQWRDGKVITRFNAGSSVFDIVEDDAGHIWASTRDGVIRSGDRPGYFEHQSTLRRPPDTAWNVLSRAQDGTIWIVTADGLYRRRGNMVERVANSGKKYGQIFSVQADGTNVLVGTSQGLYSLPNHNDAHAMERVTGVPGPVVAILRDRDGNIWAGTWGQGLYRKNAEGAREWSSRDGLADDFVRQLYEDKEGNLWIGLRGGGLSRWKDPTLVPFGMGEGLQGDYASTSAVDPQGRLWLGTWRGGLYRFSAGKLLPQPTPVSTLFFTVRTLAFDKSGTVWSGNWEGLYSFDGKRSQHFAGPETPYHHVSEILFDHRQRLWIATSDNGIFVFLHGQPGGQPAVHLLSHKEVTTLAEDGNSRIWIGTPAGAGWVAESDFSTYHPLERTHGEAFTGLSVDMQNGVWGCTLGGALWRLNTIGGELLDASGGLPGYPLYLALDDGKGDLWISSPRGILRIQISTIDRVMRGLAKQVTYRLFDREDGMRTIECHRQSQPAGARDAAGYLWFPTSRGFVRIDPKVVRQSAVAHSVRIEDVTEDGKAASLAALRLSPGQHALEIRFTALEFNSPQKLRFRYRLDGLERMWNWDNGSRLAHYNRLPPGQYTFQVMAAIGDGPWSPAETLAVEQAPEFYQTSWFEILLVLTGLLVAVLIFRWQMHLFRQRYFAVITERNRIACEWHDTLLAGFSAISLQLEAALLERGEVSERVREILNVTRKMVQHYRAEARRVIWDLRESSIGEMNLEKAVTAALHQTVEGREIACEVTLSGSRSGLSKDVEQNLLRVCQEALSNAVRHGAPKHLRVDLQYTDATLTMRVEDDGRGFEAELMRGLKTGHFGLMIMQERMRRFGGTLTLHTEPGKGTVVEATVPLLLSKKESAPKKRALQND
jgi:signal transduction histidine kinase/ligand-binding sensor domain-containing protein